MRHSSRPLKRETTRSPLLKLKGFRASAPEPLSVEEEGVVGSYSTEGIKCQDFCRILALSVGLYRASWDCLAFR